MKRTTLLSGIAALSVASVVATGVGAGAATGVHGAERPDPLTPSSATLGLAAKVSADLDGAQGVVDAFVQLDAPSAIDLHGQGRSAAARQARTDVKALADRVLPASATGPVQRLSVTSNAVSGFTVRGDAEAVRALAQDKDVVKVYKITPKTPSNKGTDVFTQALATWQSAGLTGKDVTIGVIDTGVDYTHATFGGPGTAAAYQAATKAKGTARIPAGTFDPDKFLGGYDFAGYSYDAANPKSKPKPDANPIDGVEGAHGTHVAGTAAGYGVTADGGTFRGDYSTLTDISDWKVGPGSAPEAGVYALKVFGDITGSTSLTLNALDWAADPDGDGDVSDHLDIVNLSLGSDMSPADDPENLFMDSLATIGTLSVVASGNAGDVTDTGGSPGNSASSLTVANSVGDSQTFDAAEVKAPADLVGTYPFQNSQDYAGGVAVEAPVAFVSDTFTGCAAYTADEAAAVAGKIAYLYWDDNDATRPCGSAARFNNAQAAGAVGVVLSSELQVFAAGIAGNAGIPGGQLTGPSTDALLPAIKAGTLVLRLGPEYANTSFVSIPSIGDTLNPSSSRGVHGSLGIVKPDVAAPGTGISSAGVATGNGPRIMSGTSMATPHVAGITALVKQQHPEWTPAEVKTVVMNTATHDVYTGQDRTGRAYGPERVGSGRVDALQAVSDDVLAYSADNPALVSVAFGVVPVGADTVTVTKDVTVRNTGAADATYGVSFTTSSTAGGATLSVSPSSITVPAGGAATVAVTLTADPATLAKELDPTTDPAPLGLPRDYLTMVTGRVVLTPASGGSELRVPVQAAPKPVSDLSAAASFTGKDGAVTVTGRGVDADGWTSLVAPFELKAESPVLAPADGAPASTTAAADITAVGFASTAPQLAAAGKDPSRGHAAVAVTTAGDWATLGAATVPAVIVDVNGDRKPDFEVQAAKYNDGVDFYDYTFAATYALKDGVLPDGTAYAEGDNIAIEPVNSVWGNVDTSVFDSNVVVIPLNLTVLGITPASKPTFQVVTYSQYAEGKDGIADSVKAFAASPYAPAFWFGADASAETFGAFDGYAWDHEADGPLWQGDQLLYPAVDGTTIAAHRASATTKGKLLVLFPHDVAGERYEIVSVG